MKLKKYDSFTAASIRKGTPTVSFGKHGGAIGFSGPAAAAMRIREGDKISLLQNEDDPTEWYVTKDTKGFILRTNSGGRGLLFNSSAISNAVKDSIGWDAEVSMICRISTEPQEIDGVEMFAIITASAK